jgi:2,4-didehydro-3-deoxy-L-rhamnonate hydrolase
MRLARVTVEGSGPRLVAADGDRARDLGLGVDLVAALADPGLRERAARAPAIDLSDVRWLPPVEDPHVIVCAGQNFASHADESEVVATPARPSAFLRVPRSISPHGGVVPYPAETSQLDYEVEVAALIGRAAIDVAPEQALEHVAGLCLAADVSARDVQFEEARAGSMLRGKNEPGTLPLGPWVTTLDDAGELDALEIELLVDGDLRQRDTLASMVVPFAGLVSYWSVLGLRPGDLVLSGTPAGVGIFRDPPERYLLAPGQTVECRSAQLGVLTFQIGHREGRPP